jgi:hypothetical protein
MTVDCPENTSSAKKMSQLSSLSSGKSLGQLSLILTKFATLLKEIHVAFKILAVLLGIIITLSPFIPKIIDGTRVETSTTASTTITTATKTTTTMTMKKVKFITSLIPKRRY